MSWLLDWYSLPDLVLAVPLPQVACNPMQGHLLFPPPHFFLKGRTLSGPEGKGRERFSPVTALVRIMSQF